MKKLAQVATILAVLLLLTGLSCWAGPELFKGPMEDLRIDLNPMELFHAVVLADGFILADKPMEKKDSVVMIYKKGVANGKFFQVGGFFNFGCIERILLWAEKDIPLDEFKKLVQLVIHKTVYIRERVGMRDMTPAEFEEFWQKLTKCWEGENGAYICRWKESLAVLTEKDNINHKIKIESLPSLAEKPKI